MGPKNLGDPATEAVVHYAEEVPLPQQKKKEVQSSDHQNVSTDVGSDVVPVSAAKSVKWLVSFRVSKACNQAAAAGFNRIVMLQITMLMRPV